VIDLDVIKTVIAARQLTIHSQESHYRHVWESLTVDLTDDRLDSFSPFIFAWRLLPMPSKILLLSIAQQDYADVFMSITPATPLEKYHSRQLELLIITCDKVLQTIVTLFSDWEFTQAFYGPYRKQRKAILAKQAADKAKEIHF
jgi:hypothetical protein